MNAVFTRSSKSYDPPVNPNDKNTIIHDDSEDEADEAEKEEEPSSFKPNKSDPPPPLVKGIQDKLTSGDKSLDLSAFKLSRLFFSLLSSGSSSCWRSYGAQ
ncbi:hypothetical protein Tco_0886318 [Tanacetum coccineum]